MDYFAHKSDDGRQQTVKEHLYGTAKLAAGNAVEALKNIAYSAGQYHDIGKYSLAFQHRLNGSKIKFEHATCGAKEISNIEKLCFETQKIPFYFFAIMLEFCICGHHTGLPDGGSKIDTEYDTTLYGRLKRKYCGNSDYFAYKDDVVVKPTDCSQLLDILKSALMQQKNKNDAAVTQIELFSFFTRYIFSCLTDADFIDTERFCKVKNREMHADFKKIKESLDKKFADFKPVTELEKARSRLQSQAYANSENSQPISILDMPTGSGKTLCALNIALDKVLKKGYKRVIYVLPYTSIIDQTVKIFSDIFGEYADILQHHSNYDFTPDNEEDDADYKSKLRRASENWDAPIIITTTVQFFESLYHYKGSHLRKFHNMADSVIILDEIHMLPTEYIQPCLRGIAYITKYLGSQVIFMSATMPNYSGFLKRFVPDISASELIPDKRDFVYFKKCRYINMENVEYESVLLKASDYQSSLIIVNRKKDARDLYYMLEKSNPERKIFHLSTNMAQVDRLKTIGEIKKCLAENIFLTVVSTSLIEAGVDLDFKAVFREISGLDNILQSAGRCNRNGRDKSGDVYIFSIDGNKLRGTESRVSIMKALVKQYDDISSSECISEYYHRLLETDVGNRYDIAKNSIAYFDGKEFHSDKPVYYDVKETPFKSYAQNFNFIREETVSILINNNDDSKRIFELVKKGEFQQKRALQKYMISLQSYEFEKVLKLGIISDTGFGFYELENNEYYSKEVGLNSDKSCDIML